MGTTLTGTTPQDTYDSLIKVTDNGPLSGTAKYLSDGLGNDSVVALSTSRVGVATTSPLTTLQVGNTSIDNAAIGSSLVRLLSRSTANDVQEIGLGGEGSATMSAIGNIVTDGGSFAKGAIYFATRDVTTNTAPTERMRITSAGNVGIGTTPAAWGASTRALQLGAYGSLNALGGVDIGIANNAYYDGSNWVYIASQEAGKYLNNRNTFIFSTAPAGTAGANVTFTDVVRIDSDGLKFNGDTAAANALDDYEEGTWTMGISFGGASTGITYDGSTSATYTKIGRQVTVNGFVALTNKGSSTGSARITGLPFTIANSSGYYSAAAMRLQAINFVDQFQAYGTINSTTILLQQTTTLGINTDIADTEFSNSSQIMISFTYFV